MDTDATRAIAAFIHTMEEARTMGKSGNVGAELDDVLVHAKALLDTVDEHLLRLDRRKHRRVFESASSLRVKLQHLRDELRGGVAH